MNRLGALSAGLTIALAVSLLPHGVRAQEESLLDNPDKNWRRGPVQYLLTKDEDRDFKKLKTEEDRAAFIAGFWSRRDPTPGTEENEFKELYARRLEAVNETFGPPNGRGWSEDRGMVVLLLGVPDEVRMTAPTTGGGGAPAGGVATGGLPGGDTGAAAAATRGRALFVYRHELFPGGPTPAELEFIGEGNGGYRLVTRFDESDPRLTGLEPLPALVAAAAPEPAAEPEVEEPPAPPPPAPPTPQEELVAEVMGDAAPESELAIEERVDCYKTESEKTLVTLTVAVATEGEDPLIGARITDGNGETVASLEDDGSFSEAEGEMAGVGGTHRLFQGAQNVVPGTYSVVTAVKDPGTGKVGYARREVEVPDFNQDSLQMSTLMLARKIEPLGEEPGQNDRFVLGNFKVVPAPEPVFKAGQEVIVYYQVYNTADDEASGKPRLKLSYTFALIQGARKIILGGKPVEQEGDRSAQAYVLPIAPVYPAGNYEVEVKVEDLVAGTSVTATTTFKVEKEG